MSTAFSGLSSAALQTANTNYFKTTSGIVEHCGIAFPVGGAGIYSGIGSGQWPGAGVEP